MWRGLWRLKSEQNKEWLEWLEDNPPPGVVDDVRPGRPVTKDLGPVVRSNPFSPGQAAPTETSSPTPKVVAIQIALPSGERIKKRFYGSTHKIQSGFKRHKKIYITGTSILVIAAGALGSYALFKTNSSNAPVDNPDVLSQSINKPTFGYSLPGGDDKSLDGEVRYNKDRKVVNYKDSIGGVTIIVSQQPLPEGFQDQTADKVKKLAEEFSATEVIATANPTAYIGTSVEGPQTVIFAKKDLLVFIKSDTKIDNHDWAEYITNLQ